MMSYNSSQVINVADKCHNGVLFLVYYFKKHFKACFFILKALKDILQHFKFVNW
jgi:phosphatidylglycerophosphate synthase